MNLTLHIVSFDIPYPPNYGGVIDVFYKIRSLHEAGVKIILHCFQYQREPAAELEEICTAVYYYPRLTGWHNLLSLSPYIVSSRISASLRARLLKDDFPILFEGLHTCALVGDPAFRQRTKIYRESNIEHHYYFHLFKASRNLRDKVFFLLETLKLRGYQPVLNHADLMLAVSKEDQRYLQHRFPHRDIRYLPSFHRDNKVTSLPGKGSYILYHGNLNIAENISAAEYIIRNIHTDALPELVIAGLNPPQYLANLIKSRPNIRLVPNPGEEEMTGLIRHAHINLLVTFQPTGLKLKLLHSLFQGRFCLVNPPMLAGTGLDPVCKVAVSPGGFREMIRKLFSTGFSEREILFRERCLLDSYSNKKNCKALMDLLTLF